MRKKQVLLISGNYVKIDGARVCRGGDIAFGGYTDGPFHSIRKCNFIHNIEGSHLWWSRSNTRNFLNKIREELPTSCECDLLKMESVD
jgi:hypothetical protein